MVERRLVAVLKEPYLASGGFVIGKALSGDAFPAWKNPTELVVYRGPYACLTERVHMFTRIVFILLGASLSGYLNNL